MIAVISALVCECGFYRYNSPFALTLALSLLLLTLRLSPMPRLGSLASWLSPSLFAVYMYHTGAGFNVLRSMETYFVSEVGLPVYVNHVVTALLVFWGCIVIDLPRRLLCRVARPLIDRLCGWVDEQYGKLVG